VTRKLIAARLVQARAYDGRKESAVCSTLNNPNNVANWIERQILQYRNFKESVRGYPHHRPRLGYVVKVYERNEK
jgi:hypothetical protein